MKKTLYVIKMNMPKEANRVLCGYCKRYHWTKYMTKKHRVIASENYEAMKECFGGSEHFEIIQIIVNKEHKIFDYPKYLDLCKYKSNKAGNNAIKPKFYDFTKGYIEPYLLNELGVKSI